AVQPAEDLQRAAIILIHEQDRVPEVAFRVPLWRLCRLRLRTASAGWHERTARYTGDCRNARTQKVSSSRRGHGLMSSSFVTSLNFLTAIRRDGTSRVKH